VRARVALAMTLAAILSLGGTSTADEPLPNLPDYVFAVLPEDENLDVLYFGEAGPTFLRFRVRINGQGYRSNWDGFLARLYKFADADDNGILTEAEARRPGWSQLLAKPNGGVFGEAIPALGDGRTVLEPIGGKVSVEAFSKYVRDGLGYNPFVGQAVQSANPIDQLAFNQLDEDRDGALSAAELASAEGLIRRLDTDEDEMLDQAELNPNRSPFAGVFFGDGAAFADDSNGGPFVPLMTAEARSRAARRLLDRYDGIASSLKDALLSPTESGLAHDAFRHADFNSDGRLDLSELERFLADPVPSIVLVVRISKSVGQPPTIRLPIPDDGIPTADIRVKAKADQGLALDMDGREIQFVPNESVRDFRQLFDFRFQLADVNKDGFLDRSEAEKGRLFLGLFDSADRNADDKLARAELATYLERSLDLASSRVTLNIADEGRAFLDVIDGDHDGRLSRRELRNAAKSLKPFDRDSDGRVRLAEIPRTSRLAIGRGPYSPNRRGVNFETYDSPTPPGPGAKGPEVAWFRKMDRNRDGDLSPREFLGSPEDFRKLDADGDGLIDQAEAAKGP
jgi:Ca2+-binding EF-hand superfamily protein